jgi:hypothetical protein
LQFPAFDITFGKFGERRGEIPDLFNLILAPALAFPGPAAAQEEGETRQNQHFGDFRSGAIVSQGEWS